MPFNGAMWLPNFVSFYLLVQDFNFAYPSIRGRDSAIGMATGYGLNLSGFETRWRREFPHPSRLAQVPTQPPVPWYQVSFPGVKRPGVALKPTPSSGEVKKRVQLYIYAPSVLCMVWYGMVWRDLYFVHGHTLTVCCYYKLNRFPVQEGKYPEKWEKCNK
jgi:hypothetical protein